MGLLDLFWPTRAAAITDASGRTVTESGIASPWGSTDHLYRVVAADLFGADVTQAITRDAAMKVPAMARARHIVAGKLAAAPLRALAGDTELADQPTWLYRSDAATAPYHRMLWTVDDLIFHGWSLWALRRAARTDRVGAVLDAVRVPADRWRFQDGQVLVDDAAVPAERVCLIPGPHEGLLAFGDETLGTAKSLETTVAQRAANPSAMTELHDTDDTPLGDTERAQLLDSWNAARRQGGAAYTPRRITLRELGQQDSAWLIQARNASAIDVARHVGVPAATIDASNVNSTLTYETAQGRNTELYDLGLSLYADAIAARLSLDDMVPPGVRVAFDLTQLTAPAPDPTGPVTED